VDKIIIRWITEYITWRFYRMKQRTRLWVTGDSEYKQQFVEWAKSQGVIAEDMLRKIIDQAMEHGKVSFSVDCGYQNSQQDNEPQ
jgi:methionyl-tRNA synthetase